MKRCKLYALGGSETSPVCVASTRLQVPAVPAGYIPHWVILTATTSGAEVCRGSLGVLLRCWFEMKGVWEPKVGPRGGVPNSRRIPELPGRTQESGWIFRPPSFSS
ncbi:hypothetical protein DPEC_G00148920 [Dallia pectoralis]|uniref:Uncharacterized protein n=1 Tax=Dallia pectoralis TaxID=75939 RepID=A0ACC2GIK3_DALPE|nr:hypothetical protein DPEC_G00148920 [Dallia pectoralis]